MTPERELWEKLPGETSKAFNDFQIWLKLGQRRTYYEWWAITHKSRQQHFTWTKKFRWKERADAWDAHLGRIAQEQEEATTRSHAKYWAEKKEEQSKREYELRNQLEERVTKMLATPLWTEKTVNEEGKEVVIRAPKWNFTHVLAALRALSQLGDHAVDRMIGPTPADGFDPAKPDVSREQLEGFLKSQGVKLGG